jgi:hypothetical protein
VLGTSLVPQSSLQGTHYAPDYSWTFNFFDCLDADATRQLSSPFEFVRTRLIDVTPTAVPALPPLGALGLATALLYIGMRSSSSRAT